MRTELLLAALNMALATRKPEGVIHHSDQGSQYASLASGQRCQTMGVSPSMGSRGDADDNAMAESFFASLECKLIDRRNFKTKTEVGLRSLPESKTGPRRRHSALGYNSPMNFEQQHRDKENTQTTTIEYDQSA